MAIYWSNQEGFIVKPVRSVRKYFLEWASEYGNIPVTFSGYAFTTNPDTNAYGFFKSNNMRVTYYDWPLSWDDECLKTQPSMHCKRTEPEWLFKVFDKYNWNFEDWKQTFPRESWWQFLNELENSNFTQTFEFTYNFSNHKEWSSRWIYNSETGLYEKYDPVNPHLDNQTGKVITASTVIVQKVPRQFTGDTEKRISYETLGQGDVFVIRDGIRIDGIWIKECETCRTKYYLKENFDVEKKEISLKPGLIWIAVVPSEQEVEWK